MHTTGVILSAVGGHELIEELYISLDLDYHNKIA